MSVILSAGRLIALGMPWGLAQQLTGAGGAGTGIGLQLGVGEFLYESSVDSITARAGGGQTLATPLTAEMSRIATVATSGDSVMLPASAPGLTIFIENAAANPMQVYGASTDTINAVATATGVSQMSGSVVVYTCYTAGAWFANGLGTGYAGSFETMSYANALTARAGGGQALGTPITTMLTRFTIVATAADSTTLPLSIPGMNITIANAAAANSMNIFPDVGGQINALSVNAAFALAAGKTATFYCTVGLQWHAILSA